MKMKLSKEVISLIEGYEMQTLKDNKVKLTDEERAEVMDAKAVWHHGPNGAPSPAIQKAEIKGKTIYYCHTHRAMDYASSLKAAINIFHDFIKETA